MIAELPCGLYRSLIEPAKIKSPAELMIRLSRKLAAGGIEIIRYALLSCPVDEMRSTTANAFACSARTKFQKAERK